MREDISDYIELIKESIMEGNYKQIEVFLRRCNRLVEHMHRTTDVVIKEYVRGTSIIKEFKKG